MINRAIAPLIAGFGFAALAGAFPAFAQSGWAEQRPVQFRYADQGQTNEALRNQLGTSASAAAAAVAASSGLGGGAGAGSLQNSDQYNNAVIFNPNVTNSGGGDVYLNVTINADQTSGTTNQSSSNTSQAVRNGGTILNP